MSKVIKPVSFDSEKHRVLLGHIGRLKPGTFSQVVRDALKVHFEIANGVTHHMIYSELQALGRKLDRGVVVNDVQKDQVSDDAQGDDVPDFLMELGA